MTDRPLVIGKPGKGRKRIKLEVSEEQMNEIKKAISLIGEEPIVAGFESCVRKIARLFRRAKADPSHPLHDVKGEELLERLASAAWQEPETH